MAHGSFAVGEILTAANLNAHTKPNNALCLVTRATIQTVAHASVVAVSWNSETLDPRNWHSNSTNPTRVTPDIAGWYRVTLEVAWVNDTDYTQLRQFVRKNGGAETFGEFRWSSAAVNATPSFVTSTNHVHLNGSTDFVEGVVFHANTSGGTNDMTGRFAVELLYPS